jgi:hypothetical protein
MKNVVALILWFALLSPAINLGKVWQSHVMPGPIVEVTFPDGQVLGHMLYKLDGSTWLATDAGSERRLRGDEVIAAVAPGGSTELADVVWRTWRGVAPLMALTCIFFVVVLFPRRLRQQ